MTDQAKLREAIRWARESVEINRRPMGSDGRGQMAILSEDTIGLLADAAESTLPKTKMVTVYKARAFSYGNKMGDFRTYHLPDLISQIEGWINCRWGIEIDPFEFEEVPA